MVDRLKICRLSFKRTSSCFLMVLLYTKVNYCVLKTQQITDKMSCTCCLKVPIATKSFFSITVIGKKILCHKILCFIIKFGYNVRCRWLKERALWEYRVYSWAKAVTPSAKLYYGRPFPRLLFSFFPIIESEISEQASRQVATEESNKGL